MLPGVLLNHCPFCQAPTVYHLGAESVVIMFGSMFRRLAVACVAVVCCLSACGSSEPVSLDRSAVPVPRCLMEDGSTPDGYQPLCYWDSGANGVGDSYVLEHGEVIARGM